MRKQEEFLIKQKQIAEKQSENNIIIVWISPFNDSF